MTISGSENAMTTKRKECGGSPREDAEEIAVLKRKIITLKRLDTEAANHVESVICMRTHFSGDPPYVGWKGLGLALNEALNERDAFEAQLDRCRTVMECNDPINASEIFGPPHDESQCWEQCGELGKSDAHVVVADEAAIPAWAWRKSIGLFAFWSSDIPNPVPEIERYARKIADAENALTTKSAQISSKLVDEDHVAGAGKGEQS